MAKTDKRKEILVYAHWLEMQEPLPVGSLFVEKIKGREIFSFEYSDDWLKSKYVQIIDPDLQLFRGIQYTKGNKSNFGSLLDSSPDRWGRILMKRREAALARKEKRSENTLLESDFLLGVYDEHRTGGLRFKLEPLGPFLNADRKFAAPPWTSLRELEAVSMKIENEDLIDDPEYLNWLNMLIAPGSSLGGARPKASIIDEKADLWIAKFPSIQDGKDIGAWEMVAHELAVQCGLHVAEARVEKFSGRYHTFLSKRFDRRKTTRIHYSSAMTMLGYNDGDDFSEGVSYLEIADFLSANGADVTADLEELWRRIVFSICISNTDDHLRNHGFLLTEKGWLLSPAFDINPVETGTGLKLNISETDNSLDTGLALEVTDYFRLKKTKAEKIIKEIREKVSMWESIAGKYNISRAETDLMKSAFLRKF
ncbi:MAG: HipA domain-containing protein [Ignavibacteria bacterium]|jgi:serine/threonine-protein kinase HipA|nr:HipA domain-containing protein [Ignavibacteria bacterium]MCU7526743.1 HipA domain-containing protein [Ignavibacteria bacterium]